MTIDIGKAIETLLLDKYKSEFQPIGSRMEHPDGISYYQWLADRKIISQEECDDIQNQIDKEQFEDEERIALMIEQDEGL